MCRTTAPPYSTFTPISPEFGAAPSRTPAANTTTASHPHSRPFLACLHLLHSARTSSHNEARKRNSRNNHHLLFTDHDAVEPPCRKRVRTSGHHREYLHQLRIHHFRTRTTTTAARHRTCNHHSRTNSVHKPPPPRLHRRRRRSSRAVIHKPPRNPKRSKPWSGERKCTLRHVSASDRTVKLVNWSKSTVNSGQNCKKCVAYLLVTVSFA
ncbi:hypothetical protein DEO72_LG3g2029 [Vigna unguiculata]|uniref:Uncharacterized protein n=1 Tax=Vigna unguiculata TaxID=3917 RepID=A0A4D6LG70_VIGUN|nr:hypothetical protein DEO72_LG3g2029 [Vigna unguiculata]